MPFPPTQAHWRTHLGHILRPPPDTPPKPWHTHLFRAWRSSLGDPRYTPATIKHAYENFLVGDTRLRFHLPALRDQRGIGRVAHAYLEQFRLLCPAPPTPANTPAPRNTVHFFPTVHLCPNPLPPHSVVMVHDLIPLLFPDSFAAAAASWRNHFTPLVHQASHIVTISQTCAADLARLLAVPAARLSVIPNGVRPLPSPASPPASLPSAPYLAYVGSDEPHKNLSVVLHALREPALADLHLVLVGHHEATRPLVQQLGLADRVHFLGRLDDAALAHVIARSVCLVFPSLYEGFGLPPFEAALAGAPCVCSRRPALTEFLPENTLFADPLDPRDWAATITRLRTTPGLRSAVVSATASAARDLTWERSARALLALLLRTAAP